MSSPCWCSRSIRKYMWSEKERIGTWWTQEHDRWGIIDTILKLGREIVCIYMCIGDMEIVAFTLRKYRVGKWEGPGWNSKQVWLLLLSGFSRYQSCFNLWYSCLRLQCTWDYKGLQVFVFILGLFYHFIFSFVCEWHMYRIMWIHAYMHVGTYLCAWE